MLLNKHIYMTIRRKHLVSFSLDCTKSLERAQEGAKEVCVLVGHSRQGLREQYPSHCMISAFSLPPAKCVTSCHGSPPKNYALRSDKIPATPVDSWIGTTVKITEEVAPIIWRVMLTEWLVFRNKTMKCVLNHVIWFHFYTFTFRVPGSEAGEWQWLCWTARSFLQWDMGEHLLQSYVSTHCSNCMQTLELWRWWGNWKRFQIWQRFWAHMAGSHWVHWATQLPVAMSVRPLGSSIMW